MDSKDGAPTAVPLKPSASEPAAEHGQAQPRLSGHSEGDQGGADDNGSDTEVEKDKDAVYTRQKMMDIKDACRARDLGALRSLADSGRGLLSDDLRAQAWPLLLGIESPSTESETEKQTQRTDLPNGLDWEKLPCHRDEEQVQLDVNRSFVYYPSDESEAKRDARKSELSCLIVQVLRRYPFLCYFQGYHDICQVFLLVLPPQHRADVVARLSVLRIRDFMLPSLAPTTAQLHLLPDILRRADPELCAHVATIEPFYALAGTLTMFAHNIERYHDIARLFDVLLAREPVFSVYTFAQIVLDRRAEVLDIDEPDMLQVTLGKLPPRMDLDSLICRSISLYERFPPETLRTWRRISPDSALKTAHNGDACAAQTMEQGRLHFEKQATQIKWADMRDRVKLAIWAYRRPARAVGVAVAVAALAFYLRRNPTLVHQVYALFSR